ncbi:hypothetical protein VTO42DRAFT_2980 [Malbranchea cinnamomea]
MSTAVRRPVVAKGCYKGWLHFLLCATNPAAHDEYWSVRSEDATCLVAAGVWSRRISCQGRAVSGMKPFKKRHLSFCPLLAFCCLFRLGGTSVLLYASNAMMLDQGPVRNSCSIVYQWWA